MMTRLFDRFFQLCLAVVLIFLCSCASKKYFTPLLCDSLLYGKAGENIDNVYFEAEIDTESESSKKCSKNKVIAQIKSRGFPPGSLYYLSMSRIDGLVGEMGLVEANEKGELMLIKEKMPLENLNLIHSGFFRGEESYYTLVSLDRSTYLTTSMGSDIIRTKAQDGATISVKMRTPDADIFSLDGKGFIPEEKLDLINKYAEFEVITHVIASKNGTFNGMFQIDIKNFQGGTGYVEVKRQSGEILSAEYIWGVDSRKKIKAVNGD
jgi:hypothetical protein